VDPLGVRWRFRIGQVGSLKSKRFELERVLRLTVDNKVDNAELDRHNDSTVDNAVWDCLSKDIE